MSCLRCQSEPRCWREFSGLAGRLVLRPDLFTALGVGDLEHRWFLEVDRGMESLPVVLRKCRQYHAYYQTGDEQSAHGVFPPRLLDRAQRTARRQRPRRPQP